MLLSLLVINIFKMIDKLLREGMDDEEQAKMIELCDRHGLNPTSASEEDLYDEKMARLCEKLGLDVGTMTEDDVDEAREQRREAVQNIMALFVGGEVDEREGVQQATPGFKDSDFLYWT
jgi:hypothetical protein